MSSRRVLIISLYFPPNALAGVHRARHLAKHLDAHGWTPTVLCVNERYYEERPDPKLGALVPSGIDVVSIAALAPRLTRLFGVGDIGLRAFVQLRSRCYRLLAAYDYKAVLITSAPFLSMLLAPGIRKRFDLPVVLDFQDPWVSEWGEKQSRWTKAGLAHRAARTLEPMALRASSFVTSVSETQNQQMARRYPWLDSSAMAAIPIGGDPDDFQRLPATCPPALTDFRKDGVIRLAYVGTYWPAAEQPLRALLRGFRHFLDRWQRADQRVEIQLIGTGGSVPPESSASIRNMTAELGLEERVIDIPERLGYLDALWAVRNSDGLLLFGSIEPHYTASKIYSSLMSGRPFFSLFHENSSGHRILSTAGGGVALSFRDEHELSKMETEISDALETLVFRPETLGTVDSASYAPYTASAVAREFAGIFDGLVEDRR